MSKERYKPLNSNDGESERTEETDYMVTATTAQAGKPDTDLEIAAPILTEPLKTSSSEQLIKECGWKRGQNRAREADGHSSLKPYSGG